MLHAMKSCSVHTGVHRLHNLFAVAHDNDTGKDMFDVQVAAFRHCVIPLTF